MTDYGVRTKPKGLPLVSMAVVILFVLGGAVAHFSLQQHQPKWVADARHWTVKGPPCQPVTRAVFDAHRIVPREPLQYDDVGYVYASGQASCGQIHDHGGKGLGTLTVCQFSSPGAVTVHTAKGDYLYAPQIGQPIAITVDNGAPSCVLGSTEWGQRAG